MFKKIFKAHSAIAAVCFALLIFITSLYAYDRMQLRTSIVNLEQTISEERIARKCGESEARLVMKINAMKKIVSAVNIQISIDIIASYEVALNLAEKKDMRCVLMEEMGDSMMRAYRAGVKDGSKNSYVGGV